MRIKKPKRKDMWLFYKNGELSMSRSRDSKVSAEREARDLVMKSGASVLIIRATGIWGVKLK